MLELTTDNAVAYLRDRGWIGPADARVEALGGGVSNQVLRIVTPEKCFVVKQSRPQLRTRDAWYSDLNRIYREQEVMEALAPRMPGTVPVVLFVDRDNYAFAMSHAPQDAEPWKAQLLAGQIDLNLGEHAGRVLAQIHRDSAYYLLEFWPRFCDLAVFEQLRIAPFYRTIQHRNPDLAPDIASIIEQMLTVKEALCHGDYTPKNLLVHDSKFTLVDYETAHFGDPTMDIGLFLAHILLKAVHLPARRHDYLRLTDAFWRGYGQDLAPYHRGEAEQRGIRHLAVCLLARVDGTSPVDYLRSKAQRETVRWLGRSLLEWQVCFWHDVQTLFEQGVSPLAEDMP